MAYNAFFNLLLIISAMYLHVYSNISESEYVNDEEEWQDGQLQNEENVYIPKWMQKRSSSENDTHIVSERERNFMYPLTEKQLRALGQLCLATFVYRNDTVMNKTDAIGTCARINMNFYERSKRYAESTACFYNVGKKAPGYENKTAKDCLEPVEIFLWDYDQ